jgi:hypothetical protein
MSKAFTEENNLKGVSYKVKVPLRDAFLFYKVSI